MSRTFWIILGAVAALIVAAVVVSVIVAGDDDFTAPVASKEAAPDGLTKFYDQKLSWSDCGDNQCTTVDVPIDYEETTGPTTQIRVKVIAATGGNASRSIFVNPGGPGGSAIDFADTMAGSFGDEVRKAYDIVGVDPRGVGLSSPLECLSDEEFDDFVATDPDPDDASEIDALRESVADLGDACAKNSGDLAAHISTEEVARDMDVVRALLGRKTFDWFGASYGTQLGATYAQLFPMRVGRMVLDGAVDPTLSAADSSLGQATGFQRAIEAYAADCVKQSSCPLGTDASAGVAKVAALLDQLDKSPLPTQDGRNLTEGQAFYGIAVPLYDKESWQFLTQGLTAAFARDGTILSTLSDFYFERQPDGSYDDNIGQVIYAVNCLDSSTRLTLEETEALVPQFDKVSPVFGRALAWGAFACTDWPIKSENPQVKISAEGAAPIVVLGTTRDPATPYEWSEALSSQLTSGVLVTREGDGHTAYNSGNECITDAVDAFYVDGTVPKDGLVCK